MDQAIQDRLRVQGGIDALKEILDGVLQEKMNLKGQIYVLTAQLKELQAEQTAQKAPESA